MSVYTQFFLASKYPQNAFAAGAPPRTPLGEFTALPRPVARLRGGERKGREGKEVGGE